MAQIDLKFATIKIKDGYAVAGTVTTALVKDDTTLALTLPAGTVIGVGDTFRLAGETGSPVHTVLTHTETGGKTTSLTFSPAAAGAVAEDAAVTFQPHALTMFIGDGTLEYTEHKNREYKLNQGLLKYVRDGDQAPMDVSMDFVWEFLTAASGDIVPTPEDALKKRNLAANWVTTGVDPCEPYCVDVVVEYTPPCGGIEKEVITLQYFRYEELQHSFKDAQISVKGKCMAREALAERVAVS